MPLPTSTSLAQQPPTNSRAARKLPKPSAPKAPTASPKVKASPKAKVNNKVKENNKVRVNRKVRANRSKEKIKVNGRVTTANKILRASHSSEKLPTTSLRLKLATSLLLPSPRSVGPTTAVSLGSKVP